MKQTFKKILALTIFISLLCLNACQTEEEITKSSENINQSKDYYFKKLKKEEISKNEKVFSKLLNIENKIYQNKNSKTIYNPTYDFFINKDDANYIEIGNYNSYTFSIFRSDNSNAFENLLLTLNNEGEYDAFIIKYGFTENEYLSIDSQGISKSTTLFTPIDFDASTFINAKCDEPVISCTYTYVWGVVEAHEGDLTGGPLWEYGWILDSSSCSFSWSCGGGDEGGDDNYVYIPPTESGSGGSGGMVYVPNPINYEALRTKNFIRDLQTNHINEYNWLINQPEEIQNSILNILKTV